MAEEQKFLCSGDCLNCRTVSERKTQWQYCATQHIYKTMRLVEMLQKSVAEMQKVINNLTAKIEASMNSDPVAIEPANVSDLPLFKDIAQNGSGAGIDSPDN